METGFVAIFWFVFLSILAVPLLLGLGAIIRPRRRYPGKAAQPYECGEDPVGSAWAQFNIRFYVIAIIFIIFDVEVAALFPCLVLFKEAVKQGTGLVVFAEIFVFIGILVAGLVYLWVRGDLEWVKTITMKTSQNRGQS